MVTESLISLDLLPGLVTTLDKPIENSKKEGRAKKLKESIA